MKKNFNKVIGLTILFLIVSSSTLFFENKVFAATVTANPQNDELSKDMESYIEWIFEDTEVYEVYSSAIIDENDNTIPTDVPVYGIDFNLDAGYAQVVDSENGTIKFEDDDTIYNVRVNILDSNGETITISEGLSYVEREGPPTYKHNFAYIAGNYPKEFWESAEFEFVLEPANGEGKPIKYTATFSDNEILVGKQSPLVLNTTVHVTLGEAFWGLVGGDTEAVGKLITQTLSAIALPVRRFIFTYDFFSYW